MSRRDIKRNIINNTAYATLPCTLRLFARGSSNGENGAAEHQHVAATAKTSNSMVA